MKTETTIRIPLVMFILNIFTLVLIWTGIMFSGASWVWSVAMFFPIAAFIATVIKEWPNRLTVEKE